MADAQNDEQAVQKQLEARSSKSTLPFACRCGTVTGRLTHIDPATGTHALCHCKSCRRAMVIAGLEEDAVGGVGVYQTTPDHIEIETAAEHLVPREFSPDKRPIPLARRVLRHAHRQHVEDAPPALCHHFDPEFSGHRTTGPGDRGKLHCR